MHLNIKVKQEHTYDAIVVGSGISGGWAAKELTEKGLKTLFELENNFKQANKAFLNSKTGITNHQN